MNLESQVGILRPLANHVDQEHDSARRLFEECSGSIFKITTDKIGDGANGTGWLAPDGRIVTSHHVIDGARTIVAEQNGKKYRLGRDVSIDDVNDIAVLGFVDAIPANFRPLKIGRPGITGEPVRSLGYGWFRSLHDNAGRITGHGAQSELAPDARIKLPLHPKTISDALEFANRGVLTTDLRLHTDGLAGSPILSSDGRVVAVHSSVLGGKSFETPAHKVEALLQQAPGDQKFAASSGYESGFSNFMNKCANRPTEAAFSAYMFGSSAACAYLARGRKSGLLGLACLGAYDVIQSVGDCASYRGSTDQRDSSKYWLALAADGVTLTGNSLWSAAFKYPSLRVSGMLLTGLGLVGRLSTELMCNEYSIKSVRRRNGDERPAFNVARYVSD